MASLLLKLAFGLDPYYRPTCIHDSWLWKIKIRLKLKSHKDELNKKNEEKDLLIENEKQKANIL